MTFWKLDIPMRVVMYHLRTIGRYDNDLTREVVEAAAVVFVENLGIHFSGVD